MPTATARSLESPQRAKPPQGWKPFRSAPAGDGARHWYATAPYSAEAIKEEYGEVADALSQPVDGRSWQRRCVEAWNKAERHKRVTEGADLGWLAPRAAPDGRVVTDHARVTRDG